MVTAGLILSAQFARPQMQLLTPDVLPAFDSARMVGLFLFTMTLLLLPKIFGIAGGLLSRQRRGGSGRFRFVISAMLELLFSILHAPIFMLIHSRHLLEIALGQDSGWTAQQRQGSGVQWLHLLARHGVHTLLGLLVTGLLLWVSVSLLYWMLPMVIGLILAIPLSALSGSKAAGQWLERQRLLSIPEELAAPDIMRRRQQFLATCTALITARRNNPRATTASGERYRLFSTYDA
jgi:membrane glycosyltransferase